MSQTVDWVIGRAFVHAKRKAIPPATGTAKYNVLVAIIDSLQKQWSREPNTDWDSLWDLVNIGTVTATTTFDLDDTIDRISKREGDYVLLTSSDGTQTQPYKIIAPNQLYEYRFQRAVAQVGRTLRFSRAFVATDSVFGYTINVPSYLVVDDITAGSQTVQVDNPLWLAYAAAAEFDRNDIVKVAQYKNLLVLADEIMQGMKNANGGQQESVILNWQPAGADWI